MEVFMFEFVKNLFKGMFGKEKTHAIESATTKETGGTPTKKIRGVRVKNQKGVFGNPQWDFSGEPMRRKLKKWVLKNGMRKKVPLSTAEQEVV
jgi:hypothetical protein